MNASKSVPRHYLTHCRVPVCCLDQRDRTRLKPVDDVLNPLAEVHIGVENGYIQEVLPATSAVPPEATREDMRGSVVTPRLLDCHVHLDKAHTWDRAPNRSGTFGEALQVLGKDKDNWTEEDLYRRANYALQCAYAYGTIAVRTHVDTGLPWARRSHKVMAQLRTEWAGRIELQTVSLCGVDQYAGPDATELADLPVEFGASALGGMPLMNPRLDHQLDCLLRLASERRMGVDLHVDESGDPQARTLLAVANAVLRNQFPFPVTCGHCCSLAVQAPDVRRATLEAVKAAGIHVVSLPLCNLYLQDRYTTEAPKTSDNRTPFWRGITLLQEFMQQGTITACASDNVRDAFYAYGDLDAVEVFHYSVRMGHLDNDLSRAFEVVTTAPARLMGIEARAGYLAPGYPARLIAFGARSYSEWLSRPAAPRRMFEFNGWQQAALPNPASFNCAQ